MVETEYNRSKAVEYAKKWALSRNPKYYDFENIGGDCTNYASQCIYAGSNIMNYAPTYGWYYISVNDRAPSWTSVKYLYNFLTKNKGVGPFGAEADKKSVEIGDIIQLQLDKETFQHSPVITAIKGEVIYVSAHTYNALNRPLSSYEYKDIRYIHIKGVRKWE